MRLGALALAGGVSVALVCVAASSLADQTVQREIDVRNSTAQFGVAHAFVGRVMGTVPIRSGRLILAPHSLLPISATAVLDATRIDTGDRDQTNAIRGPDFFDTQRFPIWTFSSTRITPSGELAFAMDGMLTMHGVTQPEHLNVVVRTASQPEYIATARIDRHAFGMKVVPLDPAIGATVDVTLDVKLQE